MKKYPASGLALLIVMVLVSCAPTKTGIKRNYFVLETSRTTGSDIGPGHGLLAVREFSVSPGYQSKEIVRRGSQGKARADFYNHYFMLPGSMITQLTREWLDRSGLFQGVLPEGSGHEPDYVLEGALTAIFGQNQKNSPPLAVIEINFLLLKNQGFESEFLFQKVYREEMPTAGHETEHLIQGLNACLKKILTELEQDLHRFIAA